MSPGPVEFSPHPYDLLVIGGGINGAAIANVAAGEGLRVALVEKGDFAGGTSSKSTKLIHGGLRYLERFEFDLVKESLKERCIQLRNAPHLVRPLEFIIPVYKGDRRPLWMMRLGVWMYDRLCGKYLIQKHRGLSAKEVAARLPGIQQKGLVGGVTYFDAQMDDARLCLENVLSARAKGADAANYTEATAFLKMNGKVKGVIVKDVLGGRTFEIHGRKVVCAVGPWTRPVLKMESSQQPVKIRTTKGVHLVYRRPLSRQAMLLQAHKDGRVFFVIPWMGHSLVGTTDTDYERSADHVEVTPQDIEYLMNELKRVFPNEQFRDEDILSVFAGLRPLVYEEGRPSEVSRRHVIEETMSGLMYVIGGKYTTYRKIAMDCVGRIVRHNLRQNDMEYPLFGSGEVRGSSQALAAEYGVEVNVVDHLKNKYGSRCRDVLDVTRRDGRLKERITPEAADILAQAVYAVEVEMARTSEDVLWRRLGLGYVLRDLGILEERIKPYLTG